MVPCTFLFCYFLCVCVCFWEIPSSSNIGFQNLCSPSKGPRGSSVSPDFLHDGNMDHWFPGPSEQFLEERTSHAKMALASRWLSPGCFLALSCFFFPQESLSLSDCFDFHSPHLFLGIKVSFILWLLSHGISHKYPLTLQVLNELQSFWSWKQLEQAESKKSKQRSVDVKSKVSPATLFLRLLSLLLEPRLGCQPDAPCSSEALPPLGAEIPGPPVHYCSLFF